MNSIPKQNYTIKSRETPQCPHCGKKMKRRDQVKRHTRIMGGSKVWFEIERFRCEACGRIHRAIPAFLAPFKHYCLGLITSVLSHRISPRTYEEEHNYPVEITMDRWARWEDLNRTDIEGYIRSIGHRILGFSEELLTSQVSLLEGMKSSIAQWLSRILRMIYNSGGELQPLRE